MPGEAVLAGALVKKAVQRLRRSVTTEPYATRNSLALEELEDKAGP